MHIIDNKDTTAIQYSVSSHPDNENKENWALQNYWGKSPNWMKLYCRWAALMLIFIVFFGLVWLFSCNYCYLQVVSADLQQALETVEDTLGKDTTGG